MKKVQKKCMAVYLFTYFSVMLIYCSINIPDAIGEWDDYSLPVASILNEHNISITEGDITAYKKLFPEWSEKIDHYKLSGYYTRKGGEMTWYFPVYAALCTPLVILLGILKIPAIYAFAYTNILVLMISLFIVYKYLKIEESKRNILILALSIHPIIFYLGWISAEVLLYACLIITMVCWFNQWYRRAAFAISVAGMLNPTILSVGIIMIIEYLFRIIKSRNKEMGFWKFVNTNMKDVAIYGSCYIIALVPMLYNYYNTGYINLTASYSEFVNGKESVCQRFFSYIIDLNYGLFPYFIAICVMAAVMMIASVIHKIWRFLEWMIALFVNIMLYAINIHINCGISGIARYNVWVSAILIFAVCVYYEDVMKNTKSYALIKGWLFTGICITGMIVYTYGPYRASETSYVFMTPIAESILDKFPAVYNPLHSSFYARAAHVNGGYDYQTPVVYSAEDGFVRKILASKKDMDNLKESYVSVAGFDDWFNDKICGLSESEEYISVPEKYKIVKCLAYDLDDEIVFCKEGYNADRYAVKGLSNAEEWGSWTDGNEFEMCFRTDVTAEKLQGEIDCDVYHNSQNVIIYVNGAKVFEDNEYQGGCIRFNFENPGVQKPIYIKIELPDAISPSVFGYRDTRILGLGIKSAVYTVLK